MFFFMALNTKYGKQIIIKLVFSQKLFPPKHKSLDFTVAFLELQILKGQQQEPFY